MKSEELEKQSKMPYREQLEHLKAKYGTAPENYYLDVACARKSKKNGRGMEGLFLHHDFEYDPRNPLVSNLSDPEMGKLFDYDYQKAENLTYCDYLEHLMLHCKINLLRVDQLGAFIKDGVVNFMVPQLNDWYGYAVDLAPWQKAAFGRIEDFYSDYRAILNSWVDALAREVKGLAEGDVAQLKESLTRLSERGKRR